MVDRGGGVVRVWRVEENDKTELGPEFHGLFCSAESYLVADRIVGILSSIALRVRDRDSAIQGIVSIGRDIAQRVRRLGRGGHAGSGVRGK